MKEILIQLLTKHEGLKLKPYRCTAGFLTIGIGRNIETNGISKSEAEHLLSNDIDRFTSELNEHLPWFRDIPETAKIVLIDMAFNMGTDGLMKFKKTLEFIKTGQYKSASIEMLNSNWARQVGNRSKELSEMIKSISV